MRTITAAVRCLRNYSTAFRKHSAPANKKKFRKDFYAVDATEISLNMHNFPWAEFRSTMSGVKINMKYDINNYVPAYLFITNTTTRSKE